MRPTVPLITPNCPAAVVPVVLNGVPGWGDAVVPVKMLGKVSPDGRDAMLQHAEQFKAAGIPFVFDPGQGLPMFDGAELAHFIELASWVTVNDYEARMLCERTGLPSAEISRLLRGLVVTLGGEGCEVWIAG